MASWIPKLTGAEANAILTAPGMPFELETRLVDGRLLRVYKNLWPSLRAFWLVSSTQHAKEICVVFEGQRYTFKEVFERSVRAASVFMKLYGVQKGDRVGICCRNYPDYLVAFWACHLIGAVSVQTNAWSPVDVMAYCLIHTQCKVIVIDVERADLLERSVEKLAVDAGARGILVLESHEGKGQWKGMKCWKSVMESFNGDHNDVLSYGKAILPDDDATIVFTSGTTGLPKGVLSTQRMYMSNLLNITSFSLRAKLRRGEELALGKPPTPPKGILIPVPLFHVTGSTSMMMGGTFVGAKVVLMRKWEPKEAVRLIKQENLGLIGGVPSMVLDLIENGEDLPLDTFNFGGAPAPDVLGARANRVFPNTSLAQGYGLTETNAVAVAISDEDYAARPLSCGVPCLPNDLKIVAEDKEVPTGEVGEVWLRGPNVMKGYWRDPVATDKVLTKDGWLRTGDLGCVDKDGYLYIRDRIKDIIIRGGENIDTSTVENALYSDEGVLEAAAVGVPHETLGEVVAAVVCLKPGFMGKVTEASLIKLSQKLLPRHAVPAMILVQVDPLERTPSGKIVKGVLRQIAKAAWVKRAPTAKL